MLLVNLDPNALRNPFHAQFVFISILIQEQQHKHTHCNSNRGYIGSKRFLYSQDFIHFLLFQIILLFLIREI